MAPRVPRIQRAADTRSDELASAANLAPCLPEALVYRRLGGRSFGVGAGLMRKAGGEGARSWSVVMARTRVPGERRDTAQVGPSSRASGSRKLPSARSEAFLVPRP